MGGGSYLWEGGGWELAIGSSRKRGWTLAGSASREKPPCRLGGDGNGANRPGKSVPAQGARPGWILLWAFVRLCQKQRLQEGLGLVPGDEAPERPLSAQLESPLPAPATSLPAQCPCWLCPHLPDLHGSAVLPSIPHPLGSPKGGSPHPWWP